MPTSTPTSTISVGDLLGQVNQALQSPPVQQTLSFYSAHLGIIKLISIFFTLFFIGATAYFISKTGWLALRVDRWKDVILKVNLPKKRAAKSWQTVEKHLFVGSEADLRLAIFEADKLLDEALKSAGFMGETLGEKLKQIDESKLANINEIWEAHKLRNKLAHELDFKLNRNTAERALAIYEQTFRDLGILD